MSKKQIAAFVTYVAVSVAVAKIAVRVLSPKSLPHIPSTDPMAEVAEMLRRAEQIRHDLVNSEQFIAHSHIIDDAAHQAGL